MSASIRNAEQVIDRLRAAEREQRASDYEPEPWDVVRSDGVVVVYGKSLTVAEIACYYLNGANVQGHGSRYSYEVVTPNTEGEKPDA